MPVYIGTPISGTIFIGKVKLLKQNKLPDFPKFIDKKQVDDELNKLKTAVGRIEQSIQTALPDVGLTQLDKDILNTHLMILTDIEITQILETTISEQLMSAPQAVMTTFTKIIHNFEQMENQYFAQRADDYKDVAQRLVTTLVGTQDMNQLSFSEDEIIFLKDVTPSLVTKLHKSGAKAYCAQHGSYTSHSSILSRAFGMTALVAKDDVCNKVHENDTAILDAENSYIVINPDLEQEKSYKNRLQQRQKQQQELQIGLELPAFTKNGVLISIKANIEYPSELTQVLDNHCDGIGLFRTELLYLNRTDVPDENEQYAAYSELLQKLNGLPVIIRTFDLGGDKLTFLQKYDKEDNPYLGNRGIRFSLQEKALFKIQLRAILRASAHGKAAIMFPMIICADDFVAARKIVQECMEELDKESSPYCKDIQIGAMIETPSAALCAEQLAKVCDFFSLGTNDLVQYTLAVDRNNDLVAPYYLQHHPAVIKLISNTIKAAHKAGIPVSVCGEMAAEPAYVPLLIGLGITDFSINPHKVPELKAIVRNCDDELYHKIQNFDFNTDIATLENLIFNTLKPYYSIVS